MLGVPGLKKRHIWTSSERQPLCSTIDMERLPAEVRMASSILGAKKSRQKRAWLATTAVSLSFWLGGVSLAPWSAPKSLFLSFSWRMTT